MVKLMERCCNRANCKELIKYVKLSEARSQPRAVEYTLTFISAVKKLNYFNSHREFNIPTDRTLIKCTV